MARFLVGKGDKNVAQFVVARPATEGAPLRAKLTRNWHRLPDTKFVMSQHGLRMALVRDDTPTSVTVTATVIEKDDEGNPVEVRNPAYDRILKEGRTSVGHVAHWAAIDGRKATLEEEARRYREAKAIIVPDED